MGSIPIRTEVMWFHLNLRARKSNCCWSARLEITTASNQFEQLSHLVGWQTVRGTYHGAGHYLNLFSVCTVYTAVREVRFSRHHIEGPPENPRTTYMVLWYLRGYKGVPISKPLGGPMNIFLAQIICNSHCIYFYTIHAPTIQACVSQHLVGQLRAPRTPPSYISTTGTDLLKGFQM